MSQGNTVYRLWECFYKHYSRLYGTPKGKGAHPEECRYLTQFQKAAELCEKHSVAPEDYVKDVLSKAAMSGRVINPSCLNNTRYNHEITQPKRQNFEEQWDYQVKNLQGTVSRYMQTHPDAELEDAIKRVLLMSDVALASWFRVLALDAPFDDVLAIYGKLAYEDVNTLLGLREFAASKFPRALHLLDAWGDRNVPRNE